MIKLGDEIGHKASVVAAVGRQPTARSPRSPRQIEAGIGIEAFRGDEYRAAKIGVARLDRERAADYFDALNRFRDKDVKVGIVCGVDRRNLVHRHTVDEIGDVAAVIAVAISAHRHAVAYCPLSVTGDIETGQGAEDVSITCDRSEFQSPGIYRGARCGQSRGGGGKIAAAGKGFRTQKPGGIAAH